jgi:ABC-type ATPase with predicted acetyltransferase domain
VTTQCKCGGKFRRTDIVGAYSAKYGRVMYSDTDPLVAHWKCDKCGTRRTQKKRQPKQPERTAEAVE